MEYFLELRFHFREVETYRSVEVSLEELSEILICSERNVKRLLKNMEHRGLIYWKPGVGRGKRSKLYFKCSLKKALLSHVQDLLKRGKHKEAMDWVKRKGLPVEVRDACFGILLKEFSFPRIGWADYIRIKEQFSARFRPVLISSASGKWMFVESERVSPRAASCRPMLSRTIEGRNEGE